MRPGEVRSIWPAIAAVEDAVIGRAGSRCECRGVCGRHHAKGGGRCDRGHHLGRPLYVVPADPELRIETAAAVRASKRAMCGPCWELAHKIATRQAATVRVVELPDLFAVDLDPADLGGGEAA